MANKRETFFLGLVHSGVLIVKRNGRVYNSITGVRLGKNPKGKYRAIGMRNQKGRMQRIYIHRLMWLVFKGPIPLGYEINHKNGKKHHNRLSNLECITGSENMKHAFRIGLRVNKGLDGEDNGASKLTTKSIYQIFQLYTNKKWSYSKIAVKFGVTKQMIRAILIGRNWVHLKIKRPKIRTHIILNSSKVIKMRKMYSSGESISSIARIIGCSRTAADSVVKGKSWASV